MAQNPETGNANYTSDAIYYTYDANGNLYTRQDGRFASTIAYDKLNRPVNKAYTDPNTSTVNLCYDGLTTATGIAGAGSSSAATVSVTCSGATQLSGVNAVRRLTFEMNANSSSSYNSFDTMGRVLSHVQKMGTTSYPFQYLYNVSGQLEQETYPSLRKVQSCYDIAARPNQVANVTSGSSSYASTVQYTPHGAISSLTLGNTLAVGNNGLNESYGYSGDRLQPTSISAANGTQVFLNLTYSYCAGSSSSCTNNNGNVQSQTMTRPNGVWTDSYTSYDALNRLTAANETGTGSWSRGYGYDAFGNRWVTANTNLPALTNETPTLQAQYSQAGNNQIYGWTYDGSGNITQVGGMARSFTYDAENRQITANIGTNSSSYAYDGERRRVQKTAWNATTTFVYDAFGQLAAEYGPSDDAGTKYLTGDSLGSTRLMTAPGASEPVVSQNLDYLPFGQELGTGTAGRDSTFSSGGYPSATGDPSMKFTGKERDAESGLDFFEARYYSSAQGRFTTPDWSDKPEPVPYANPQNPQTLNLYTYGNNNPLRGTDPDGHCTVDGEDHGFFWCAGHAIGATQTQKEQQAVVEQDRSWLMQNVASNGAQRTVLQGASNSTVTQLYGQWNSALQEAQFAAGQETAYDASLFSRAENGQLVLYRGGGLMATPKDVKVIDSQTGLLNNTHGVSLNVDPSKVSKFGDPQQILSVPPELRMIQRGKDPGHFEITPRHPGTMNIDGFNQFLQQVVMKLLGPG